MRMRGELNCVPAPPPPPPHHDLLLPRALAGFINTNFLEKAMQGYGVPYQVVPYNMNALPRFNLTTLLWNIADGSGSFSAIVM